MSNSAFTVGGGGGGSGVQAWGSFTVSGTTYTLQASTNVTSITRLSLGQLSIAFTTPFSTAYYAVAATYTNNGINEFWQIATNAQIAGSVTLRYVDSSNAYEDPAEGSFIMVGTQ